MLESYLNLARVKWGFLMLRYCEPCGVRLAAEPEQPDHCPRCGTRFVRRHAEPTLELPLPGLGQSADLTRFLETHFDRSSSTAETQTDPLLGTQLQKYRIEQFLGQGGMARVYRAFDEALHRWCAIKVLRPDKTVTQLDLLESFLAEARTAAALVHPNVVKIHTLGCEGGQHFIEMEYVAGSSLHRLLETEGPLQPLPATRIMLQIGSALAAAHKAGMIHRDIKPANVLVAADGEAKLADFGLAKRLGSSFDTSVSLSGTPAFMAPELFAGERASRQSDIYAMGVTFFNLLSGNTPYAPTSLPDLLRFHQNYRDPELVELQRCAPPEMLAVLARCLAKEPADRYPDAAELTKILRELFGKLRSLPELVQESLADLPLTRVGSLDRFEVDVALPSGRRQLVQIQLVTSRATGDELIEIYSAAAPARESEYRHALELNVTLPRGAIGIERINGENFFVVVENYPRATCDPRDLRQGVLSVALTADDLERKLVGGDIR